MSLANKLSITDVDLKDKRVLIRVSSPPHVTAAAAFWYPAMVNGGAMTGSIVTALRAAQQNCMCE